MPKQNRVSPFGELVAASARGTLMGNRGVLHDEMQQIVRQSQTRRWICCLLAYKDWKRPIMVPNRYTELFFLDEATALAAGHRPCALCRRADYNAFRAAWQAAHSLPHKPSADEMDAVLHPQRLHKGEKVTYRARLGTLPAGVMVSVDGETAALLWHGVLFQWSFTGYTLVQDSVGLADWVSVLTPQGITAVMQHGYRPQLHPSIQLFDS